MGTQDIHIAENPESRKAFLRHLLDDVEALDRMLSEGLLESGITRIGAEQEFCLVNSFYKPANVGPELLPDIADEHFTTELARFNLEINLDPQELRAGGLQRLEAQLNHLLQKADDVAGGKGLQVALAGILPSIDYRSVQIENLSPARRYHALDEVLKKLRGGDFELNISGVDELIIAHNNILFEACNTSFQCHYQVQPDEFVENYNWAQAIAGPVLAVCANSPLLIGRQLWAETRIPLFQQSIDTRNKGYHMRERQQRVTFGNKWIQHPTEVYRSDIARHTTLFATDIERSSLEMLDNGEIPALKALQLHNGTVYKWNRPCYGIGGGVPHLRIENRYLPSGPTVEDEIANLAFWTGLMSGMPEECRTISRQMRFENVKENFQKAAMWGSQSVMTWNDEQFATRRLIEEKFLPIAEAGLQKHGVKESEISRYLSIIQKRVACYKTGARWQVKSFRNLREAYNRDEACVALTAIMQKRRHSGKPVHEWELAEAGELSGIRMRYENVGNMMSTDLITVTEHDLADLVLKIMEWRNIRHLPVEDHYGQLKGMIFKDDVAAHLQELEDGVMLTAADVMVREPICISPDMEIVRAAKLLKEMKLSCFPVVDKGKLIGLLTDKDTAKIWKQIDDN